MQAASPRQRQGREAEAEARAHLEAKGLRFVAGNYYCRLGELDLVMLHGSTLVFVEVRERKRGGFGGALASVTRRKQEKIIVTAQHFLQHHPQFGGHSARFDVVAIDRGATAATLEWLQAAFTL